MKEEHLGKGERNYKASSTLTNQSMYELKKTSFLQQYID